MTTTRARATGLPERYVTLAEASALCGPSVDTLKRRLAGKMFPGARKRDGDAKRTWEIPLGDLVAAGLLDEVAADQARAAVAADVDTDPVLRAASDTRGRRLELEVVELRARVALLKSQSDRQDAEVMYLRKLLATVAKASA